MYHDGAEIAGGRREGSEIIFPLPSARFCLKTGESAEGCSLNGNSYPQSYGGTRKDFSALRESACRAEWTSRDGYEMHTLPY